MQRTVLHVDINSYFATLLQQENPALRGRAIGVIKDAGRTCIIAASKEAKLRGVGTGWRARDARAVCPEILCIPASFDRYLDATKRLKKLFLNIAPNVFIYSLDEAFIDITDCRTHLYPKPYALAQHIQQQIKHDLGEWVTCNIGISHNRFLAKMTSEISPKGSITAVTEENKDHILSTARFRDVCGIGIRLEKKLHTIGVRVPYQIRFIPDLELEKLVGPFWRKQLKRMAYGKEPYLLQQIDVPKEHMKSVGRSITGYRLYEKDAEIRSILYNLCVEIIHKVRTLQLAGRQVSIGLKGQREYWRKHITFTTPINQLAELIDCVKMLYEQWEGTFKIIKFSVRLSLLKPQQDLLLPDWQKAERVQQALDTISKRYGYAAVIPATISKKDLIMPEVTGFLGDREYQLAD